MVCQADALRSDCWRAPWLVALVLEGVRRPAGALRPQATRAPRPPEVVWINKPVDRTDVPHYSRINAVQRCAARHCPNCEQRVAVLVSAARSKSTLPWITRGPSLRSETRSYAFSDRCAVAHAIPAEPFPLTDALVRRPITVAGTPTP